jgi:hypothetical protein
MTRIVAAFVLAPLLASVFFFRVFAIVAFPFMLVVTLVLAVPLFLLLRRVQRLSWWHALLAGAFCGLCVVLLSSFNPDRLISRNNILFVGLGALAGTLFWWIGIFRNSSLPFISTRFPWSFLLVVPLAVAAFAAHQALEEEPDKGRVVAIVKEPSAESETGLASVRLSNGSIINAVLSSTWPLPMIEGKCVHLMNRWSTLRARRIYEVSVPFGAGFDDC